MTIHFEDIISIPKSLYVCFRLLPAKIAIKMPLLVRYNVKLLSLRGSVHIEQEAIKPALIRVGFGNVGVLDLQKERTILQINGNLHFQGKAFLGQGCRISIGTNAICTLGCNFRNSAGLTLICEEKIDIKDNVLIAWDTCIMDSDYHATINTITREISQISKPIIIGNNVWIGMGAKVLKGTTISDGCILAAQTIVHKDVAEENCIIAGNPQQIVKRDITRLLTE